MPPPPPPPPLPPPSSTPEVNKPEPNRNALLQEIRHGTRLKKAVTNDRSTGIVGNCVADGGGISKKPRQPKLQLGGLFSEGVPKLRHVENKFSENRTGGISSNARSGANHLYCANSYPSSPVSSHKNSFEAASSNVSGFAPKFTSFTSDAMRRTPFPNDVTSKGPAPPPPPVNNKNVFETYSSANKTGPPLPNKPPGITRSSSHCHYAGRVPRISRSPPSVKPPPPPKNSLVTSNEPPALPSKPPSLVRRLSYGAHDTRNGGVLHHANSDMKLNSYKNFCISSDLQVSPTRTQSSSANKITSSPAPPSRTGCVLSRPPNVKPPPPPVQPTSVASSPVPPTTAPPPPPPPPHHYRILLSQTKSSSTSTVNSNSGHVLPPPPPPPPPPPTRIASVKSTPAPNKPVTGNFESRFKDKFHSIQDLTPPNRFTSRPKLYPSKMVQSHRRQPAPPPPRIPNGNSSQPKIHIQLESRFFSSNVAEC